MSMVELFWLITLGLVAVMAVVLLEIFWLVDYNELAEIWGSIWVY